MSLSLLLSAPGSITTGKPLCVGLCQLPELLASSHPVVLFVHDADARSLSGTLQGDALMALSLSRASPEADFQLRHSDLAGCHLSWNSWHYCVWLFSPTLSLGFFSRVLGHHHVSIQGSQEQKKQKGQAS